MRIFHPRPQPGRQKFIGVEFRDGVAEVDELHPERRTALIMHGYTIEEDSVAETVPLPELTVAELREIARFEGVELPTRAKKADIVAALEVGRLAEDIIDLGHGGVVPEGLVLSEPDEREAFIPDSASKD